MGSPCSVCSLICQEEEQVGDVIHDLCGEVI
jgi:hypothetical protein